VQKGYNVPQGVDLNEVLKKPDELKKFLNGNRQWIGKGLQDDAKN
jgi:hypothetical protein